MSFMCSYRPMTFLTPSTNSMLSNKEIETAAMHPATYLDEMARGKLMFSFTVT
jgi:hypothetical protein